ncbi:hypothetical protein CEUSTIGMA_g3366.t1 [Chlamydomonas eustigma]|uniref:Ribosomal RNA methyltransferase FtsJ domain-containing protein n=1 Tax=Chlamydomonas eustigma TaxID=1157962 RepID=A0A250WYK1_9CHLO|nr:hypothetical protein CEUSTIGMA_g3366.t1 [Chlamydomonas eustigma]|eukprot:GAX75923.1 hypothetical protein CEUSTIGMA_g3366.t1 [Chlamydomonas eustigma]
MNGIRLSQGGDCHHQRPVYSAAIDLGAAPGAWSMFLSSMCELVVAVDPAELHPYAQLPNIHHIRKKASDACRDLEALLRREEKQVDVLTCDMNMHPVRASQVLKSFLQYLKPGGQVVLTLKFTGTGRDRSKMATVLQDVFQDDLEDMHMIWLLSNTVCEQTWIGRVR